MGVLKVMTSASTFKEDLAGIPGVEPQPGDTKILWDADNEVEVEAAKATFDKLTSPRGGTRRRMYYAYKTNAQGEATDRVREFDPNIEAMVLIPQLAGG